jgi:tetratricopeptide (TPR) repeat protein
MREIDLVRLLRWWPTLGALDGADLTWLVERIEGHPRSVQWLDELAGSKAQRLAGPGRRLSGNLRREVLEKVLPEVGRKVDADLLLPKVIEAVGADAEAHLRRTAVLVEPAPWGAILALEDVEGTGERLVRAGLVSAFEPPRGGEPLWAPPPLVVRAVGEIGGEEKKAAHRRVGAWFRERWEEDKRALGLAAGAAHHLCEAGDGDGAWEPATQVVLVRRRAGRFREALGWAERALGAGATGARRGTALTFQVQLGLRCGSPPENAEVLLKEAEGCVEEHDRSFVLGELAKLLRHQGRLGEAASVLEQSVALETKLKGEEHLDVAISLHELAGVLHAQGDLPGAREWLERALRIQAKLFGTEEHPNVAASLSTLAGVLKAQGDLPGARERLERALRIQAKVIGTEEHPDVAASLHELAGVLKAQGDLPGALERLERVLAIHERIYGGRDHYLTAITEMNLGRLLFDLGEKERAFELLRHAHQTFLASLGPAHPYTQGLASLLTSEQVLNALPPEVREELAKKLGH